jgi:hypothetical protein
MWFLELQTGDNFQFAPTWAAIAMIGKHRSVSCWTDFHPADWGIPECLNVISWASSWGQLPICPILGCNSNDWQAQECQLLNGLFSCRLRNTWVSCQVYDNDSITGHFLMNVIPWASSWGQRLICPILGCNCNYWQAQKPQLPNRFLSCWLRNAWVSWQEHDNDSITGLFIMNVIPWASSWGQRPIRQILGCNCNYWQAQKLQLTKGFLSCRLSENAVSTKAT